MKIVPETAAYNELYLEDAQTNIAWCFEYGVRGLKYSLENFVEKFLAFEYLNLIETGNPHFISGMSGVELAILLTNSEGREIVKFPYNPSENYWTGFVAAIYQWAKNITFAEIFSAVTPSDFLCMYKTFHEQDIMNVLDAIDEKVEERRKQK